MQSVRAHELMSDAALGGGWVWFSKLGDPAYPVPDRMTRNARHLEALIRKYLGGGVVLRDIYGWIARKVGGVWFDLGSMRDRHRREGDSGEAELANDKHMQLGDNRGDVEEILAEALITALIRGKARMVASEIMFLLHGLRQCELRYSEFAEWVDNLARLYPRTE